ncbi:MAG TPA: flagellar biosynthetic protein FliO [Xanthobacteraceae bacterium]|nr:flagellar biosynthetic protein FliO [Xanthobacteraceae bacterium]
MSLPDLGLNQGWTFIVAFIVVLALIGASAWLVRKLGAARLAAGRGRQPRLAVIDAASVDSRRKLIIIRRDNVEHLLMIGGPTDVVVETNILRAAPAAQRETPAARGADTLPRATPLPDATTTWPPQPEAPPTPRVDRPRLLPEEPAPMPPPTPVAPPPSIAAQLRALTEPPRPQPAPPLPNIDPLMGLAAELSRSKIEPTLRAPEPLRAPSPPTPSPTPETPVAPSAPAVTSAPLAPDVQLAEMAHRLETALRRPIAQQAGISVKPDTARQMAAGEPKRAATKPAPTNGPANPPTNGGANGAPSKSAYESLEQEMASLLGRQSGKT